MQKIQAQLKRELEALSKVQVKHRVEGYRITESARALLSAQRARHDDAIRWRKRLLSILGDDLGTAVHAIHAKATWQRRYTKFKIYSSVEGNVAIVQHGSQGTKVWHLAAGEEIKTFLSRHYGSGFNWFAK